MEIQQRMLALRDNLLNNEEQQFIEQLYGQADDGDENERQYPVFSLQGSEAGNQFLALLGEQSALKLEACFRHFRLVFPVAIKPDEFERLHLHLLPPAIYEQQDGFSARNWRVALEEDARLLQPSGEEYSVRVEDISLTGVSITTRSADRLASEIELQLTLAKGEQPVRLHLNKVRQIDRHRVAYKIESDQANQQELLRSFLFEEHRKLFPELEGEQVVFNPVL